jgi:hypothetical protein
MRDILAICVFLLATANYGISQTKYKNSMDRQELQRLVNNAFNKLVSSNPNAGEIANYATVDPINASFSLKSTLPVQPGRKKRLKQLSFGQQVVDDPAKISYLSLSLSGNLIDKNYGTLFTNSKINAGVTLNAQYHFWIGTPQFSYWLEDYTVFDMKRSLLRQQYDINMTNIHLSFDANELQKTKRLLELTRASTLSKISKNQGEVAATTQMVDVLGANYRSRPSLIDTLLKLVQDGQALKKSFDATNATLDSLAIVGTRDTDFMELQKNRLRAKYKKDYDGLIAELPLQRLQLTWVSLISGYTRKSYNTYDPTLPFASQFGKGKLNTSNFGVAINHLRTDSLARRTLFLNFTLTRTKDNNLSSLSTTTIEQRKEVINAGGDTIRTITSKVSAYTKPISTYRLWNVSLHGYYMFGKTPSGIHLFPSIDIKDGEKAVTNFTLGYIIPFQNTAKDQPVVNAEIYVRFNDMFNSADDASVFYNRNEIGVSFTFPFKIF